METFNQGVLPLNQVTAKNYKIPNLCTKLDNIKLDSSIETNLLECNSPVSVLSILDSEKIIFTKTLTSNFPLAILDPSTDYSIYEMKEEKHKKIVDFISSTKIPFGINIPWENTFIFSLNSKIHSIECKKNKEFRIYAIVKNDCNEKEIESYYNSILNETICRFKHIFEDMILDPLIVTDKYYNILKIITKNYKNIEYLNSFLDNYVVIQENYEEINEKLVYNISKMFIKTIETEKEIASNFFIPENWGIYLGKRTFSVNYRSPIEANDSKNLKIIKNSYLNFSSAV